MEILFMNGLNGITISRNIFRRSDGVKFTDGDGELGRGGDQADTRSELYKFLVEHQQSVNQFIIFLMLGNGKGNISNNKYKKLVFHVHGQ